MAALDALAAIIERDVPLAGRTALRVGGPARRLARPRDAAELGRLLAACRADDVPLRVLGGGNTILVPDAGVEGVVAVLDAPAFRAVAVDGKTATVGAGASLADAVATTAKASLSGLEALAGSRGTLGGALCHHAGNRGTEVGQFVRHLDVVDPAGSVARKPRSELDLGRDGSPAEGVIVAALLELSPAPAETILRRLKRAWIGRHAARPASARSAQLFRDPRGHRAADLIVQAGLRETRVGGAELAVRDPNLAVAHDGCTAADVERLLDLVRATVERQTGVALEPHLRRW